MVQGRDFGFVVGGSFCGDGVLQGTLSISNFSAPARVDWKEGDATPVASTLFPTKLLPLTEDGLVVRTDFSDDAGWEQLKREILEPNTDVDDLVADVHFVDDRCFEGASADQIASTEYNGHAALFLFVADRFTFTHPDHPVLAVDCEYEPRLACRILPKLVGITEVQISEQNEDYDECTDGAGSNGIVRN